VSDGRWYQLESGYQSMRGEQIPIGTTAATVAAAANAVGWDRDEALRTAGFEPIDYQPPVAERPLADIPTDELLRRIRELWTELKRRIPPEQRPVTVSSATRPVADKPAAVDT
jgi:hypothetical protein